MPITFKTNKVKIDEHFAHVAIKQMKENGEQISNIKNLCITIYSPVPLGSIEINFSQLPIINITSLVIDIFDQIIIDENHYIIQCLAHQKNNEPFNILPTDSFLIFFNYSKKYQNKNYIDKYINGFTIGKNKFISNYGNILITASTELDSSYPIKPFSINFKNENELSYSIDINHKTNEIFALLPGTYNIEIKKPANESFKLIIANHTYNATSDDTITITKNEFGRLDAIFIPN